MVITRVGAVSCARIAGTLYAILGLIIGAIFSLAVLAGAFGNPPEESGFPMKFGATAVFILPVLYGCIGFVAAFIGASLYNVLANRVGGIELDVQ
jgi:hypothetical protein